MQPAVLQLSPKVDQDAFAFHGAQQHQQQHQQHHDDDDHHDHHCNHHQQHQHQHQHQHQQYPLDNLKSRRQSSNITLASYSPAISAAPGIANLSIDLIPHTTGLRVLNRENYSTPPVFPPRINLTISSHPPLSDHYLRRKTPGGALAAGYDGSLDEGNRALHPPATKQLRISNMDGNLAQATGSHRGLGGQAIPIVAGQAQSLRQDTGMHISSYAAQCPQFGQGRELDSWQGAAAKAARSSSNYNSHLQAPQMQLHNEMYGQHFSNDLSLSSSANSGIYTQYQAANQPQALSFQKQQSADSMNDSGWNYSLYRDPNSVHISDHNGQLSNVYQFNGGVPLLQQMQQQQQQQALQQSQHPIIPTVLPYVFQRPSPGPTAPAGIGPYGPYWPDGTLIPYRPAALRDARFLSHFVNNNPQSTGLTPGPSLASGSNLVAIQAAQPYQQAPFGLAHPSQNVLGSHQRRGNPIPTDLLRNAAPAAAAIGNPAAMFQSDSSAGFSSSDPLRHAQGHPSSGLAKWDQGRNNIQTSGHHHHDFQQHIGQQVQAQAQEVLSQHIPSQPGGVHASTVLDQSFTPAQQSHISSPAAATWKAGGNLTLPFHTKIHNTQQRNQYLQHVQNNNSHLTRPLQQPHDLLSTTWQQLQQLQQQQQQQLQQQHQKLNHNQVPPPVSGFLPLGAATSTSTASVSIPAPLLDANVSPEKLKENVLTWAHSVYIYLLSYIHHTSKRKDTINVGGVDVNLNTGATSKPKPSIYPKPPRKPGSTFAGSNHSQQNHSAGTSVTSSVGRIVADIHNSANIPPVSSPSGIAPSVPSSANAGAVAAASASASRLLAFGQTSVASPVANARTALDLLSSLCVESCWNWIDGMLLGGCLAYGLEEYDKAFRWYSGILRKDSEHVEALSNLAATLLALDKREEALEMWKRAVSLRPSYFEAVEHLIGLLCSSGRARQAVDIIKFVEDSLRLKTDVETVDNPSICRTDSNVKVKAEETETAPASVQPQLTAATNPNTLVVTQMHDQDAKSSQQDNRERLRHDSQDPTDQPGFGSSGFAIAGADNGRMLALIHAKGNMLYALGQNFAAAAAFEDAVLIGAGPARKGGVKGLIKKVVAAFLAEADGNRGRTPSIDQIDTSTQIVLLYPSKALHTARLVFPNNGAVPGFQYIPDGLAKKAAISTMSNSLLSLSKIYQDSMAAPAPQDTKAPSAKSTTVGDILALYYLSLSLQPSPSTANNVGILLASIQQGANTTLLPSANETMLPENLVSGVVPSSSIALALSYYYYGLNLDSKHAHLYTNLGSLLKDIGHLAQAIRMYEQAVQCEPKFDIALANLANALKDSGRVNDSIVYYKRAVQANPEFAEAVCGLANSLNSVCNWVGRGGIVTIHGVKDRWHVDDKGLLLDGRETGVDSGWIKRVVDIVEKQLREGRSWGCGVLKSLGIDQNPIAVLAQLGIRVTPADDSGRAIFDSKKAAQLANLLQKWSGHYWEGARVVRLIERIIRYIGWQWYQDRYVSKKEYPSARYSRPRLPLALSPPNAPTVLPFHTFTTPLSAKQIRHISQRNGLRISCSTLQAPWLPETVYRPPSPPDPYLNVGYVSSDFNNHPLAHLMQSVFGLHNPFRVKAFCYATTPGDGSIHRKQIEREAPVFRDVSSWSTDKLVQQIVNDGIHILVNLNGYTRGARNEVFAARPAPIHMSFMGFAGTLGAEWCDYILSDKLSIPLEALSKSRRDLSLEQQVMEPDHSEDQDDWVYDERIVYTRYSFFCCDHKQSAPDYQERDMTFQEELDRRWKMRKEMFPNLSDNMIILGNFNQLYKIEPTTFRTWIRILAAVPNAILWLLRFPEPGEKNLRQSALAWAGEEVASRIVFTDVAPKQVHISRARICDIFIDTPECNAHTTAADILWSGTPLLTYPRYSYKTCSRMASSILSSAFPFSSEGRKAASELIVSSDEEYEARAIELCRNLSYPVPARPTGRLVDMRRMLFTNRFQAALFDTRRWVEDLEEAYFAVWNKWAKGEENDMCLPLSVETTS
ncbi:hypothetical protein KEM54_005251 [Ascosphaera aggregata]|nr:hypothetical protein KEM54_005251 [Ascosphaera aggregata]